VRAGKRDFAAAGTLGRHSRAVATLLAFLPTIWLCTHPAAGQAKTTRLTSVADALVRSDRPNTNYGRKHSLSVSRSPLQRAYLRFNLRASTNVTRAVLRLYAFGGDERPAIQVRAVRSANWNERTITFAKRPPVGALVRSARRYRHGQWIAIDVTSAVERGGPVAFALTSSSRGHLFLTSRESGHKPQLLVTSQPLPPEFALPPTAPYPGNPKRPVDSSPAPPSSPPPDPPPPPPPPPPPVDEQPGFPIRAAFYYPSFPEAWTKNGMNPYTHFNPTLGFYSSDDTALIRKHLDLLEYANVQAGISSWWGTATNEDNRLALLLDETVGTGSRFRWAPYYEKESVGDPSSDEIESDLGYLKAAYGGHTAYLRVDGKPVIFVHADASDGCGMADRWQQANASQGFYVVLEAFPGSESCSSQPSSWRESAPDSAAQHLAGYSYSISPGFWKADESSARLGRDAARWGQNIRDMVASAEPWQLITTFNGWGEGTSVEPASEWASCETCTGIYLNYLHRDGTPPGANDPVVAAAGDVSCSPASGSFNGGNGTASSCRQVYTSDLLVGANLAAVLLLGDSQYEDGALSDFEASYDLSWGRVKSITYPAVGNHEYNTPGAAGYFDYFNGVGNQTGRAGDRGTGYYSFDIGSWHLISLNSNCGEIGGCGVGSPEEAWLRADLAAHPTRCTLAYWHHPRYSSGTYSDNAAFQALWQALQDYGAELVLSGHDHNYQRYAPQSGPGVADANGIRQFVVGTGGKVHYPVVPDPVPNREAANGDTFGVLKLTLHTNAYDWQFQPEAGGSYTDSGSATCH